MDLLEQLGEFQTAMALFDAGVDLSCQQIQARQEAQGAVALVFVVPAVAGVLPRHGRKVWCYFANGLDPWLFVQGQYRHQLALVSLGLVATLELFLQDLSLDALARLRARVDLAVDHQDLSHLGVELGITPLQVVIDLVGPKFGAGE